MDEPLILDLRSHLGNSGDFEHLLDYGSIRYHLLLSYNDDVHNCAENNALNQLYAAVSLGDQDAVSEAVDTCIGILWPFLCSDFSSRTHSELKTPVKLVKLRVLTIDGVLCVQNHDQHLEYPQTKPIVNTFPTVPVYKSSDVEVLEEISMHIFRVKVLDSVYCMKSIHRTGREADFIRRSTNAIAMCSSLHYWFRRCCGSIGQNRRNVNPLCQQRPGSTKYRTVVDSRVRKLDCTNNRGCLVSTR